MTLRAIPGPSRKSTAPSSKRSRPAEGGFDVRDIGVGILLVLLGCGLLTGLFEAAESLRFDTLLVASKSIYNVISGVRGIGMGIGQMLLGLAQMLGFAALAAVSIAAVLAIFSGTIRIGSQTLPRLSTVWNLLSQSLQLILLYLAVPLSGGRELRQQPSLKVDSPMEQPQRSKTTRYRRAA